MFAYPSLVEGFGLPVLEAMAAGLAVVASDAAAVQEVADGAALIVPANASEQWARALGLVLSDAALAKELRRRAGQVAAKNTWARAADRTLEVLAAAARAPAPETELAMLEPQGRRSVTGPMPAVGPGGSLPPRIRRRRIGAALVLLLLLGAAKAEIPAWRPRRTSRRA